MNKIEENERLSDDVKEYEREIYDLKQLIEISKGLNSTLDYNVLIDSILLTCMGQMQLLKAGIFLLVGLDREIFYFHRNYKGFEIDHEQGYVLNASSDLIKFLDKNNKCYTLDEIKEALPGCKDVEIIDEIGPMLLVPLKGKGTLNGIIILGERINKFEFTDYEKEYLLNIASLAGIAIQNAFLYEVASTDMMTKLKIHHFFQITLAEERERSLKQKSKLSLIMLDVDHFKIFNDTYGHLTGDAVLKNVADVVKKSIRHLDVAARYGGEEIAVILPNTDLDEAIKVSERIRTGIEKSMVKKNGQNLSVTVSIGVTEFRADEDFSNHAIIERADQALYSSKRQGRNQVNYLK